MNKYVHIKCHHNHIYTDPVLCLDVLCELDLFWILPWQSQVQLALWAGKCWIRAFSFHFRLIARLTIQTPPTLCVSFPSPGGTSSPSLSTCSTHFSLSPGTWWQRSTLKGVTFVFCEGRSTAMCRLCTWSIIALFPGSPGGDQSGFSKDDLLKSPPFSTDLLGVAKQHLVPS